MKRRDFIKLSSLASLTTLTLHNSVVQAFTPMLTGCDGVNDRILVIVQLNGGNDGLNTVIPIEQYDTYANLRPTIKVPDTGINKYITLDSGLSIPDQVGLNPMMTGFKDLYNSGDLSLIQGVGYDLGNKSHFKSTDIMLSGGDGNVENSNMHSGWMARYLTGTYPGIAGNPQASPDPLAIQIGSRKTSLGFISDHDHGVSMNLTDQDPAGFYSFISGIGGAPLTNVPNSDYGDQIEYIMNMEVSADGYAQRISDAFNAGANAVTYPSSSISDQLKTVSRLISGGLKSKVYLVRHGGYDTHNDQVVDNDPTLGRHALLMKDLSDGIKTFQEDLRVLGADDRVLTVSFSEFGRKVAENGSFGTDHGTVAPMFIVGKAVNAGVFGTNMDLTEATAQNNWQFTSKQYDYRAVFTTLVQDWLGATDTVTSNTFYDYKNSVDFLSEKIPGLISDAYKVDPSCYIQPTSDNIIDVRKAMFKLYPSPATTEVSIEVPGEWVGKDIMMYLYSVGGKKIDEIAISSIESKHQILLDRYPKGQYLMQLQSNSVVLNRQFTII